jgi:lysophospholipase L1-like esterase
MLFLKHKINNSINRLAFCLILFGSLFGKAQTSPYGLSFVDYTKNKISYSKDSSEMMDFFKKVDELRSGKRSKVTIVHYGGSHIQAGFWGEKIISNFQAINNFEGGGLYIFPFKLASTNSPGYYKTFSTGKWKRYRCATIKELCENLGMAGIAVVNNDSATTFGVKLTNTHHKKFNIIKVYHNFNSSFEISIPESIGMQVARKDIKEKGFTAFAFESFVDSVNFKLVKLDTNRKDFMLYGFSVENTNPGFFYAGFGVNGASSDSYLKCNLFREQLETLQPDLVIFSLGVNDTQGKDFNKEAYINHYDSMIAEVRKASPSCAILLTTTTDNFIKIKGKKRRVSNSRTATAGEAMFEMMETHKAAVWDLYGIMGGYKSMSNWLKAGLAAKDKVHFNARGYGIVGQLMFDAIDKSYRYNSSIKEMK